VQADDFILNLILKGAKQRDDKNLISKSRQLKLNRYVGISTQNILSQIKNENHQASKKLKNAPELRPKSLSPSYNKKRDASLIR
jgi:hypothetical protein